MDQPEALSNEYDSLGSCHPARKFSPELEKCLNMSRNVLIYNGCGHVGARGGLGRDRIGMTNYYQIHLIR